MCDIAQELAFIVLIFVIICVIVTVAFASALKDITSELRNEGPLLERTLRQGLNLILGLSERKPEKPLDLGAPIPAFYSTTAVIEGPDLQLLDSEIVPSISIDVEVYEPQPGAQPHKYEPKPHIDKRFSFRDMEISFNITPQIASRVEFTLLPTD